MNCPKCNSNNTQIINSPGRKLILCHDCNYCEMLEYNKKIVEIAYGVKSNGSNIKCTYCGSTNTRKLGLLDAIFSLNPMKKIGNQWHCKNCGSNF